MGLLERKDGLEKLDDEQIEDVAGGYAHLADSYFGGYSIYEVIDDESGDVLATFDGPDSFSQAKAKAQELDMTPDGITDNQLSALRYRYKRASSAIETERRLLIPLAKKEHASGTQRGSNQRYEQSCDDF